MSNKNQETKLQINERIQVTLKDSEEAVPTTYYSRVEDFRETDFVIGWPTSRGLRAPAHSDTVLVISFVTGTAVYAVDASIVERILDPIPLLVVRPLTPFRNIQRREYVRVLAMVDVELTSQTVVFGGEEGKTPMPLIISTRTFNLSGGGFAIHYPRPIQIDLIFDVKVKLPGRAEPLLAEVKVVRCEAGPDVTKERYYDVGFAFVHMSEAIRRHFVSYVFKVQQSSILRD
jgi:c-di-GMP-binding flagellar brake protein YcgR